jgi:uncharacterized protein
MRSVFVATLLVARLALAAEPAIPPPTGFVTDTAHVLDAGTTSRLTSLLEELEAKTGAEIAVLTVDTTAPLDDFSYAMRVFDTWKPGKKGEDTGLVLLLAVKDRKLRVITGYGLEGILPDGLVGQLEDQEIVPALRAGRTSDGIERGVRAFASRIASSKGVTLTGVPPPQEPARPPELALSSQLLMLGIVLGLFFLIAYLARNAPPGIRGSRRSWGAGPYYGGWDGGFGGGGGWGGGGGGFGGFGGGSSGGGGAGRSW